MGLLPSHSQPTFILGLLLLMTGRKGSLPFLQDRSLGERELGEPRYHQVRRIYLIIKQMQRKTKKVEKGFLLPMLFAYLALDLPKAKLFFLYFLSFLPDPLPIQSFIFA